MAMVVVVMAMVVVMTMVVVVMAMMVMMVTMATVRVRHGRAAQCESRTGSHNKRSATQRFERVEHGNLLLGKRGAPPRRSAFPGAIPKTRSLQPIRGSRHEIIRFNSSWEIFQDAPFIRRSSGIHRDDGSDPQGLIQSGQNLYP
jgi:hypothetical protein